MLDRYPLNVDVKGGRVPFLFNHIYLVSNYEPEFWYPLDDKVKKALYRRL